MGEQHNIINIFGRNIHYRIEGRQNYKTIVLLHGFMQNRSIWNTLTLQLMNKYKVISIDLPGHGYSDIYNNAVHTMDFMASCVHETLTNIGVGEAVIIGHSMGGYVALSYAQNYPNEIKGLGLINSHAMSDNQEHQRERDMICERIRINAASFVVEFVPTLFAKSNEQRLSYDINSIKDECLETKQDGMLAAQEGMRRRQSTIGMLSNFSKPVLFIYGKQDRRIPLEVAITEASLPKYSTMILLENAGHMTHIECPKIVKNKIVDFVDSCYTPEEISEM